MSNGQLQALTPGFHDPMLPSGGNDDSRTVHVYVASYNTVEATELCIRSMREYAGYPFQLTVGESGSQDGSLTMLMRLKERGWLSLELATQRRIPSEWLEGGGGGTAPRSPCLSAPTFSSFDMAGYANWLTRPFAVRRQ